MFRENGCNLGYDIVSSLESMVYPAKIINSIIFEIKMIKTRLNWLAKATASKELTNPLDVTILRL